MDRLAKEGQANIGLPIAKLKPVGSGSNYDFSYSGLKTAVININHKIPDLNKADLCASFQKVAAEMLITNTFGAAEELNINKIVLAGGVAANTHIRQQFEKIGTEKNKEIYLPELKYCTDNAAMIASAGYYNYLAGNIAELDLNAVANLKIGGKKL